MAENKINDQIAINHDNAVLLLAAAQELGLDPSVVATTSDGTFNVPQEVVDKAGLGEGKKAPSEKRVKKAAEAVAEGKPTGDPQATEDEAKPVKKAAAKRAPAKKATAKKAV